MIGQEMSSVSLVAIFIPAFFEFEKNKICPRSMFPAKRGQQPVRLPLCLMLMRCVCVAVIMTILSG
jgi:hypothetical protein